MADTRFVVEPADAGKTLAALLRGHEVVATWSQARRLIERGKVFVDGECVTAEAFRVAARMAITVRIAAPVPRAVLPGAIVFEDAQVVLVDKPAGLSSVPFDERETDTAMDLVRAHWRRAGRRATETPLHIVHRIDKETSGLLIFAKTKLAERFLQEKLRAHDMERTYLCVVHGGLTDRRIESRLIEDRGDGRRGSTREPNRGKRAVTHVKVLEPLGEASLCEVRLETGKTHQIRIHLAENGHPLVGERVYIRDWEERGNPVIPSPRLLLHAATLGFQHPVSGEMMRFESVPPPDFERALAAIARRG